MNKMTVFVELQTAAQGDKNSNGVPLMRPIKVRSSSGRKAYFGYASKYLFSGLWCVVHSFFVYVDVIRRSIFCKLSPQYTI